MTEPTPELEMSGLIRSRSLIRRLRRQVIGSRASPRGLFGLGLGLGILGGGRLPGGSQDDGSDGNGGSDSGGNGSSDSGKETQFRTVATFQDNITFRVDSMTEMLTGENTSLNSPVDRRRAIMERRRDLLNALNEDLLGESSANGQPSSADRVVDRNQVSITRDVNGGSGEIGITSTTSSPASQNTVNHSTPSMSDVDVGTKRRANERN